MFSNNKISNFITLLFLVFCVQFTDLKIGLIKVSELLLLSFVPILLLKKINNKILILLLFFSIEAIISLVITYFLKFEYLTNSTLKSPYFITIGRYLELVSCIVLSVITYNFFKSSKDLNEFNYKLKQFININIFIVSVFLVLYFLVIFNIISIDDTRLVYSDNRLRGYFVEGGPFGLMLSFIFILTGFIKKTRNRLLKRIFLLIIIIFIAKSKAGILCTFLWLGLENFDLFKRKIKAFVYPILIIAGVAFYFLFVNISSMYISELNKIKVSLKERPQDTNVMMGRIAGVFIVPKMISENPLFGIGTGNYPLLRNNQEYRGFFPLPVEEVRVMDSHSFGGLVDLVVDNGLIGITFFLIIMYFIYKEKPKTERVFLLGFLSLFLFGVQIYFLYPWILLGLLLIKKQNIYETSS